MRPLLQIVNENGSVSVDRSAYQYQGGQSGPSLQSSTQTSQVANEQQRASIATVTMQPPPISSPMVDLNGSVTRSWSIWFQKGWQKLGGSESQDVSSLEKLLALGGSDEVSMIRMQLDELETLVHVLSTPTNGEIGLGNVENTRLSTWVGSTNITTLGTITTGTWHGSAIGDSYISSAATWNAKQAAFTILTTFGNLANASGWLKNDGSGNLSYSTPSKSDIGLSNVENTALSTWVGTSNIATVGTITTGVWHSTAIADAYIASAATWNAKAPTASPTFTGTAPVIPIAPSANSSAISRAYALSRGMNLLTNGQGSILTNYNFPSLTFDQTDLHGGLGMFTATSYVAGISSELIPVDITRTYRLSGWVKLLVDASKTFFAGVVPYDVDGNSIDSVYYVRVASTNTTLSAPLKPGDTTISLTSAVNWSTSIYAGYRHIVIYGYQNSLGFTYPDYTYSRITSKNYANYSTNGTWSTSGISGNTITLTEAWPATIIPATHRTGASEPTWPTSGGGTVYDGNILWTENGVPAGGEASWSASTTKAANNIVVPTVANGHKYIATSVNVFPAGTSVANANANLGTYKYCSANGITPTSSWTKFDGYIGGGYDTAGAGTVSLFPYGTTFISPVFIMNYNGASASKMGISDLWLSEMHGDNIQFVNPPVLPSFTVSTVPAAASWTRGMIYVSNESGGATPAFSDGTNWRRVADRAIIS